MRGRSICLSVNLIFHFAEYSYLRQSQTLSSPEKDGEKRYAKPVTYQVMRNIHLEVLVMFSINSAWLLGILLFQNNNKKGNIKVQETKRSTEVQILIINS